MGTRNYEKEIIWESDSASDKGVNQKEVEFINSYRSNDPAVGYNQWPKFKGCKLNVQIYDLF
jgi:hypothetical protein